MWNLNLCATFCDNQPLENFGKILVIYTTVFLQPFWIILSVSEIDILSEVAPVDFTSLVVITYKLSNTFQTLESAPVSQSRQ